MVVLAQLNISHDHSSELEEHMPSEMAEQEREREAQGYAGHWENWFSSRGLRGLVCLNSACP